LTPHFPGFSQQTNRTSQSSCSRLAHTSGVWRHIVSKLFTARPLSVHVFTACSLCVSFVFPFCSRVHGMFTLCFLCVHVFTACSLCVHFMFTCSRRVHFVFPLCSRDRGAFTLCFRRVHRLFTFRSRREFPTRARDNVREKRASFMHIRLRACAVSDRRTGFCFF
jgi:hypothetical protein